MEHIKELANSIGDPKMDAAIRALVGVCELLFPDRVRAYYLTGSAADGTLVASSDIDLEFIFKGKLTPDEDAKLDNLWEYMRLISPYELDFYGVGEDEMPPRVRAQIIESAVFLYGDAGFADRLPMPSREEAERIGFNPVNAIFTLRKYANPDLTTLVYPLTFPNPSAEFLGYEARPVMGRDGQETLSTKDLVAVLTNIATGRIAAEQGRIVTSKKDSFRLYRELVNDEWTDLIAFGYETCRNEWNYQLPENEADRTHLHAACVRTLEFENFYLQTVVPDLLLRHITNPVSAIHVIAIKFAGKIHFPQDERIVAVLQSVAANGVPEAQQAAQESLARLK
jgi:predicted nucleotidyltransferase